MRYRPASASDCPPHCPPLRWPRPYTTKPVLSCAVDCGRAILVDAVHRSTPTHPRNTYLSCTRVTVERHSQRSRLPGGHSELVSCDTPTAELCHCAQSSETSDAVGIALSDYALRGCSSLVRRAGALRAGDVSHSFPTLERCAFLLPPAHLIVSASPQGLSVFPPAVLGRLVASLPDDRLCVERVHLSTPHE